MGDKGVPPPHTTGNPKRRSPPRKSAAPPCHGTLRILRRDLMRRALPVAVCVAALALALPARAVPPLSLRLGADALLNGGPRVLSLGPGGVSGVGRRGCGGGRLGGGVPHPSPPRRHPVGRIRGPRGSRGLVGGGGR